MSIYKKLTEFGEQFVPKAKLFKFGFNASPMYRRSTGKVVFAAENLSLIKIKLRLSWKNKNYVNSMFGGSMFSAVDPIPMIQLIHLLGKDYVVWDKAATIRFKRPAREHLFADFTYTQDELKYIKSCVNEQNEIEIEKLTELKNKNGDIVYSEILKTIYIADKNFFKNKRKIK
ncbi:DUF4442 domain-containing protein [Flavicella sp.]|uniref:DUF4442 domain-containing protein n=1 Tax=Flavicella sp. TaxID=2957742 RepID=UPI00261FF15C|nr:DUF4442 domain-containing protein [Flavicella sp.]MDG1805754.1 DUF4442 domain-containing protein [Flavicella sp.]